MSNSLQFYVTRGAEIKKRFLVNDPLLDTFVFLNRNVNPVNIEFNQTAHYFNEYPIKEQHMVQLSVG